MARIGNWFRLIIGYGVSISFAGSSPVRSTNFYIWSVSRKDITFGLHPKEEGALPSRTTNLPDYCIAVGSLAAPLVTDAPLTGENRAIKG